MSALKTYIAGGALIFGVSSVPGLFISGETPAPIEVHSLSIDLQTGMVTQDRTIESIDGGLVPLNWAARIETAEGQAVYECAGSGHWAYRPGRGEYSMPLDEWVGHEGCSLDVLTPGVEYILHASWWPDSGRAVTQQSAPFVATGG